MLYKEVEEGFQNSVFGTCCFSWKKEEGEEGEEEKGNLLGKTLLVPLAITNVLIEVVEGNAAVRGEVEVEVALKTTLPVLHRRMFSRRIAS